MTHSLQPPGSTVVLDAEPLLFPQSGIGIYVRQLVQALVRRSGPERWRLSYASRRGDRLRRLEAIARQEFPGVPLHLFRLPGFLVTALDRHLRHWVRPPLRLPALYHATSFVRLPWGVSLGLPTVLTIYDLAFLRETRENFGPPEYTAILRQCLPRAAAAAAAVLTISEFTRREVQALLGVPAERIFVSPLGTQWEGLSGPPPDPRADTALLARHHLPAGGYFLSVGLLSPRKNFGTLLKAFAACHDDHPDMRLVIVGRPGWDCDALVRDLTAGIPGVTWLQHLSTPELQALYRQARGFVLLSWYEGFGIPVLEAMQVGCPVCVSTGSSLTEVSGNAGLSVSPGDPDGIRQAMQRLWTDDGLCARLREEGQCRARLFSWDHTARVTLDAYEFAEHHAHRH